MLAVFPIMSYLSEVAAVVVLAIVRRNLSTDMKILGSYIILSLCVSTVQGVLALKDISNLWTLYLFSPLQFVLLMLVYYFSPRLSAAKPLALVLIGLYFLLSAVSLAWRGTIEASYSYFKTAGSLLLVIASCYALIAIVRDEVKPYLAQPIFWVASANVVYFASTAVLFALSGALFRTSMQTLRIAWSFQAVTDVLAKVLYMKGLWCLHRT